MNATTSTKETARIWTVLVCLDVKFRYKIEQEFASKEEAQTAAEEFYESLEEQPWIFTPDDWDTHPAEGPDYQVEHLSNGKWSATIVIEHEAYAERTTNRKVLEKTAIAKAQEWYENLSVYERPFTQFPSDVTWEEDWTEEPRIIATAEY